MDGLSVAASIAGLVSLADTVFTRTYRYAKAVRHATKEINELATGVRDLSSLLHGLNLVLLELEEQSGRPKLSNLADFRLHHVSSCLTTLTNIQKKLDKHQLAAGEPQATKRAIRNLKWPFSVDDTKKLLAEVEKHKTAISVALSGDTLATVLRTLSRQDDLAADIKDMTDRQDQRWAMDDHIRMDKKRKKLLDFFGKIDPQSNHARNLKLRHPLTGLWITEGLAFREWLLTRNSKLWLSGIPGAGKTVIAASIIEETMKESSQDRAVAYFYCDYLDVEKQSPLNILGSLASQLARQNEDAFSKLEEFYGACHPNDKPSINPEPRVLAETICQMASCFDDVSIILDGLDECGLHTSEVVELLVGLASDKNSNTRALFLSRDEGEIRGYLRGDYSHMEVAAQSEDLRLYVAAEMETRQQKHGREKLRIRSTSLKEHMMKTLVDRADGMFRWVVCQLDYLCSLPNDAEKRKALGSLPPGLNATYERILERINQNDESIQRMVQNTLQWIVSPIEAIPVNALCHAISIQDDDKTMDQEAFYDEESILMHCSSLIRRSANGETLEMAHFTVKEFLSGLNTDTRPAYSRYSQSKDYVFPQLAITCLTYITLDCFRGNLIDDKDSWVAHHDNEYPFRQHAVKYWVDYAQNSWENTRILALAKILFDPVATACFLSWARDFLFYHYLIEIEGDKGFNTSTRYFCAGGLKPLHMATALGLVEICHWLITSGCNVNDQSNVGTPLHCALLGTYRLSRTLLNSNWSSNLVPFENGNRNATRIQVLDMLISNDADCNTSYQDRFGEEFSSNYLALYSDVGRGAEHPLVKLVAAGTRVEKQLLDIMDDILEEIMKEEEFIEALINGLERTNQDHSIRLQAALKLNSSKGLILVKAQSIGSSHISTEDLVDIFRSAVRFDQTQIMEELVRDSRLNISFIDKETGATFLHDAAERNSVGAARMLLSLGVGVNSTDLDKNTPLHFAVYGTRSERYNQCISLLLDHGANVNAVGREGRTVWHDAALCSNSIAAMSLLLTRCENETQGLFVPDGLGLTPVLIAAREHDSPTCELLVSHPTYVHGYCKEGLSLVHYAVKINSISLLRMLQAKGIELTERTRDGRTGLHFMSSVITLEIVRLFTDSGVDVNSPAFNGETPLHILASMSPSPDAEVFDLLFDIFATKESINSTTTEGLTPLHYALHPPDHLDHSSPEHAETLIARGADVQMQLADGTYFLGYLIKTFIQSNIAMEQLSRTSNSKNITSSNFQTYVDSAWEITRRNCLLIINSTVNLELLTELIDCQIDNLRLRPLNWILSATSAYDIVDLLLEKGIDVDLRNAGTAAEASWSAVNTAICDETIPLEIFRKILKRSTRSMEPDNLGNYLIHITCMNRSESPSYILEELISHGFNPNLYSADGSAITPLMLAAWSGKQENFQILVDHGANVRAKDSQGWEAAHHAAACGRIAIIEQLLEFEIDWESCINNRGANILHLAIVGGHDRLINFIVQKSLLNNLDCGQNSRGRSTLCLAIGLGDLKIVQILLSAPGVDVNVVSEVANARPIHLAVVNGHLDIVRELLKHDCILEPDSDGITPQLCALADGRQDIFKTLEEYEMKKRTELSTDLGTLSVVAQQVDEKNNTAISKTSGDLEFAILAGNLKILNGLVDAGFSIHHPLKCGCKPLLFALGHGKGEIFIRLLELGGSVEGLVCASCPASGYSVIHLACIDSEGIGNLKLLLHKHPSTVSLAFKDPLSPLHVAAACNNFKALEMMLQYWQARCLGQINNPVAEVSYPSRAQDYWRVKSTQLVSIYDAQIDRSRLDDYGDVTKKFMANFRGTPLHLAVYNDRPKLVKLLLQYGASIDSVNELGETPLNLACAHGSVSTVQLLLDSEANLLSRDHQGRTPAMRAAAYCRVKVLTLFLDRHEHSSLICSYGWTLLHHAVRGGPKIFAFLIMQGCCPYVENYAHETPAVMAIWKHKWYPGFLSLVFNLDLEFDRLKGILSQTRKPWSNCSEPMVRFFLKRAPRNAIIQELEATTWRNGSVLGDATEDGQEAIVKLLVQSGANLELDRGTQGTPLLAACSYGRCEIVKYFVRAGAKVFSTKGGRPYSAVDTAGAFPDIIRWLLVERYTEQHCIEFFRSEIEELKICPWSGIHRVRVKTAGLYARNNKVSLLDQAKILAKFRRGLQRQAVNIFDEVKDNEVEG